MKDNGNAIVSWISNFYRILTVSANLAGCFCLVCMTIITLIAIFWRYALNSALPWPEEATRYLFIVATYMGISVVASRDAHLKMEVLSLYAGKTLQKLLQIVSSLITTGFFCYLCHISLTVMVKIKLIKQTAISFPLPIWIIWAVMCVAFLMAALQALHSLCRIFMNEKADANSVEVNE